MRAGRADQRFAGARPGAVVDRHHPPHARPVVGRQVIEPGQRAVLHGEGECGLRVNGERQSQRGAYRTTVRDGDDVAPAVLAVRALDGRETRERTDRRSSPRPAGARRRPRTTKYACRSCALA